MDFSIESITPYQAKNLLDHVVSFSNDLKQFIIFNREKLIQKTEELLNREGKTAVFPVTIPLFKFNEEPYNISKKYSEITVCKELFRIQNEIESNIYELKFSHGDSDILRQYEFLRSKSLYAETDTIPNFDLFLRNIISNTESYINGNAHKDGLFTMMKLMNFIMEIIIYKSYAIGIRLSINPHPEEMTNIKIPSEFNPATFTAIYNTIRKFYVSDEERESCFSLVHILGDFHNDSHKTHIEENLNSFLEMYFDLKKRLNESSNVKITPVSGAKDFINSLSDVKGKMDKPKEFYPVVYGDTSCIPSSMTNTMFAAYIHSLKLPSGFSTTPSSRKVTNFFGEFKRNYKTCCIYSGNQINIIISIDNIVYLLGENLPTGEVILVELDPDKFSYTNIYTVNILGEYRLESGDIL